MIYFAQYLITGVNTEQKTKAIEHLTLDAEDAIETSTKEIEDALTQLKAASEGRLKAIGEALKAGQKANNESAAARVSELQAAHSDFSALLVEFGGKKARRNIKLDDVVIAERGDAVDAAKMGKKLNTTLERKLKKTGKTAASAEQKILKQAESDEKQTRDDVFAQEEQLRERLASVRDRAEAELAERVEEIEGLTNPLDTMDFSDAIISEQRAAEVQERYPGVVQVGMGRRGDHPHPGEDRVGLTERGTAGGGRHDVRPAAQASDEAAAGGGGAAQVRQQAGLDGLPGAAGAAAGSATHGPIGRRPLRDLRF